MEQERRLKPIYDALEVGNYREALALCNKALKKQPDLHVAKALKAAALERTGRMQEALDVCQELQWIKPTDEATLRTLSMVLRSCGKNEPLVKLYENASKVHPTNENFAVQWFMAHARLLDLKGQQMAALALNKNFKKSNYMFWAIMSITLQGQKAPAAQAKVLYMLAERMMIKAVSEDKLTNLEELQLYLIILLDQQNREKDALAILDGELGVKTKAIENVELRYLRISLLIKTQQWDTARDAALHILREINSDDWRTFVQLFDTITLSTDAASLAGSERLAEARKCIDELVAKETKNPKRGPFLAQIELEKRVQDITGAKDTVKILELLVAYFEIFGSKSCCFEDLQGYVSWLSKDDSLGFCAKLREIKGDKAETAKDTQVQINITRFERFAGKHSTLNFAEKYAQVNALWKLYEDALPLGKDLEETERQYGDDYAIMASHILIDLHKETKSYTPLLNAAFILEHALKASKHNYQMKLLLIRIYSILGAFNCACNIYGTMSIRHVQHDTMSHYVMDRALNYGQVNEALNQLYEGHQIYHSNESETPEMILQAYKYSTFSKIPEFIEFHTRLENSLQKVIADRELIRLEFLKEEDSVARTVQYLQELEVEQLQFDANFRETRIDNRDKTVMLNWNPKDQPTVEQQTLPAPRPGCYWTSLFTTIPRVLKIMAHGQAPDETWETLLTEMAAVVQSDAGKLELTAEEIKLAEVMQKYAEVYKQVYSSFGSSEAPTEAITAAKEKLVQLGKLVKREANVRSTGVIPWSSFHALTSSVELVAYLNVANHALQNVISVKAGKKATYKPLLKQLDEFMNSCRQVLQGVQTDISALRNIAKSDRLRTGLMYELCDESSLDFVRSPNHRSLIEEVVLKVGSSWSSSLVCLQQQAQSRMI
ncbi:N-alpha-acetyltransferase 25, NatB auxiliary subunit [Actinomortierella ambigua]|uniref:N-alpha-acetyltransferase 25, NatB auxiliary subunit n=1 Tax=Actinomortierella ambigua TaxID=1343610 RepID=A0A9P6U1L2_9FUNG|nr:N-alpha-acetyltransferase 25, NatB auxiliary subunit [Actinomortierella ambigua]